MSQDDIKLVCRQLRHQVTQTALAADQANRPWQTKYRPSDLTSDYLEEHLSYENPLASVLEDEFGIE